MKVSYANMKLKTNTAVNTFEFCGQKIEVLKYLPAADKYDLLMITLQKSLEGNIYNEFKLNLFFELNLVYMYTNISFTEKQREDEFKLYDTLRSNGFFELFYEALDDKEYEELFDQIAELKATMEKSKGSVAGVIANIIEDLPANAEAAAKIVENFDPSQFQAVVDFARYANGGRDINTNQSVDIKTPLEVLK
ncbi:MAG: hypothetical protein II411_04000 [Lachnospiraceae bacterium]|nr:hypothetical protein [Lachnospiraceae bacterium]